MALSNGIIRELRTYFLSLDRQNVLKGNVYPDQDDTLILGSPTKRFHAVYANRIIGDSYENISSSGGGGDADHADTLGDDYLTASIIPTAGQLVPLEDDSKFPDTVFPDTFVAQDTAVSFTSITISSGGTGLVDGLNISAHDHSGGDRGQQVDHADLLSLSADHHPIYTRWDDTEKIIKEWKFTNIADENHDFDEYVGWSIQSSVALTGDPPVPDKSTAQSVIQTLNFTDPSHPSYEHSYPMRIISHAEYSAIQMGDSSSPALEMRNDDSDISLTIGNILLSNASGIDVNSLFTVDPSGSMTATSGYIGSWEILNDKLQGNNGNTILDDDGFILLSDPIGQEVRLSSESSDYRLWIGSSSESTYTGTTAKFIVDAAGSVVAETLGIKGLLQSWGTDSWKITSDGHLTAQSITARGRLDTIVFAENTVSSISGVMSLSKGATFATDVSSSDTEIYLDDPIFSYGDIVLVQPSASKSEWFLIASQPTQETIVNADGESIIAYKYSVTRDYDDKGSTYDYEQGVSVNGRGSYAGGNSPQPMASGTEETAYGEYQPAGAYSGSGGGWLTLDGENAYLGVNIRTGPLPGQYQDYIRIGNLEGWVGYSSVVWGFGIGDANNYFTYDKTNGLTIYTRDGSTQIDSSGIFSDSYSFSKETGTPSGIDTDTSYLYFDGTYLKMLRDQSGSESTITIATEFFVTNGYLSLSGGTMAGNISMQGNKVEFTNFTVVYSSTDDSLDFLYTGS